MFGGLVRFYFSVRVGLGVCGWVGRGVERIGREVVVFKEIRFVVSFFFIERFLVLN